VLAYEIDRPISKQAFDNPDGLFHSRDAHASTIKRDASPLVFWLHPTRPYSQFETTTAENIQRRCLLCQHDGMTKVVVEHKATYT
jgi:hypothetical protein